MFTVFSKKTQADINELYDLAGLDNEMFIGPKDPKSHGDKPEIGDMTSLEAVVATERRLNALQYDLGSHDRTNYRIERERAHRLPDYLSKLVSREPPALVADRDGRLRLTDEYLKSASGFEADARAGIAQALLNEANARRDRVTDGAEGAALSPEMIVQEELVRVGKQVKSMVERSHDLEEALAARREELIGERIQELAASPEVEEILRRTRFYGQEEKLFDAWRARSKGKWTLASVGATGILLTGAGVGGAAGLKLGAWLSRFADPDVKFLVGSLGLSIAGVVGLRLANSLAKRLIPSFGALGYMEEFLESHWPKGVKRDDKRFYEAVGDLQAARIRRSFDALDKDEATRARWREQDADEKGNE